MQINSLSRPGCLVALVLSHHKAKVGEGRREHEKRKRRGGGKKHEIPFVLTTKAIRGPEGKRTGTLGRWRNAAPQVARGRADPGGRVGGGGSPGLAPAPHPERSAASRRAGCHTALPSLGAAAAGEEEEEEAEEDTKPAPLTQKMTLKPKMKYLMQQLTSGPL